MSIHNSHVEAFYRDLALWALSKRLYVSAEAWSGKAAEEKQAGKA